MKLQTLYIIKNPARSCFVTNHSITLWKRKFTLWKRKCRLPNFLDAIYSISYWSVEPAVSTTRLLLMVVKFKKINGIHLFRRHAEARHDSSTAPPSPLIIRINWDQPLSVYRKIRIIEYNNEKFRKLHMFMHLKKYVYVLPFFVSSLIFIFER